MFLYRDFEVNLDIKLRVCCGTYLKKLGFNQQWVCPECKSIYEIHFRKVPERNLSKENIDFRDEFLYQEEIKKNKWDKVRELHKEFSEILQRELDTENKLMKDNYHNAGQKKIVEIMELITKE